VLLVTSARFGLVAAFVVGGLGVVSAAVIGLGEPRPLAVVQITPPPGATDVSRDTQVVVMFSRPVDPDSARAALRLDPETAGYVSVAGRRAAFTPRSGLRGATAYTVVVDPAVRDRGGRPLASPVVQRFHTEPLALVVRDSVGRLLRTRLERGESTELARGAGAFAVGRGGALAYVREDAGTLTVEQRGSSPIQRVALPPGSAVRELQWSPAGNALLLMVADAVRGGVGVPYLVKLDATPSVVPFGPSATRVDPNAGLVSEALKKSLVEIVYRRESLAFTPDGRSAIIRDESWDLTIVGLDGARRGGLGPFLAVGNVSARGDLVAVVDVNPADPALRRQIMGFRVNGQGAQAISSATLDSHSPMFAPQSDRIAYATGAAVGLPSERHYAIEVVELGTAIRRRITQPPAGQTDSEPRWSPDEVWLSFLRAPSGTPEGAEVWVVTADGSRALPLAPLARDARWVP
jgi:Bacterial Ig-like domain